MQRDLDSVKISKIFYILLIVLLPLVVVPQYYSAFTFPKETIFKFGLILIALSIGLEFILGLRNKINKNQNLTAIVFIFLVGIITLTIVSFLANNKEISFRGLEKYVFLFLLFIISTVIFNDSKNFKKNILVFLVLSGTVVSCLGLLNLFGIRIFETPVLSGRWRFISTIGNPNMLGEFILPLSIFSLGLTFSETDKKKKFFFGVLFLLNSFIVLFTQSRAVFISYFTALIIFYLIMLKNRKSGFQVKRKFHLLIIPTIIILTLILSLIPLGKNKSLFSRLKEGIRFRDYNTRLRVLHVKTSINMFLEKPFGRGINNYKIENYKYLYKILKTEDIKIPDRLSFFNHPHNEYLNVLVETGILGFLLFFGTIVFIIFRFKKRTEIDFIDIACFSAFIGILINALFSGNLHQVLIQVVLLIIISILLKESYERKEITFFKILKEKFKPVFFIFLFAYLLMGITIIGLFAVRTYQKTQAEINMNSGIYFYNQKMYAGAIKELRKVLIYDKHYGAAYLYLCTSFFNEDRYFQSITYAEETQKYLGHPQLDYILGISFIRTKQSYKAIEHLEIARYLFRNNRKIELDIAKAYLDIGMVKDAKVIVWEVYEKEKDNVKCLMLRALIFEIDQDYKEMLETLKKIIELDPYNIYANKKLFDYRYK